MTETLQHQQPEAASAEESKVQTAAAKPKRKTAKKPAAKKGAGKKLVIVESPAKGKTIKKYLGRGYEVVASMGHIRDLPKSKLGVDIENDFTPQYINIRSQSATIKELKAQAKQSSMVYLATDPDREGEAISWHLTTLLGLPEGLQNRVTFNEITKTGVKNGMAAPRTIDMDLVDAQQARRVLDRLVGYKISPLLWRKIRSGLSAGRVQSVVVSLIVKREDEILSFVPEEYWSIEAVLHKQDNFKEFTAKFLGKNGEKIALHNKDEADAILKELEGARYVVQEVKLGTRKKSPPPPFITSTLQQEASRRFGFQSRRTMQAAQELYEGMDVEGVGTLGLITYMRTDSLRLSDEARQGAKEYILSTYGERYYPETPRIYKSKNAQDGHEAIRPTTPSITPAMAKDSLTSDQFKIYKLVWERFMASQMESCVMKTVRALIDANGYTFGASGYRVEFDGYTVLYDEAKDEEKTQQGMLPPLEEQEELVLQNLQGNQHFTAPPPRYTEASLIKTLEENGIGRPSTYAPTIGTVLSRRYVEREGRQLKPTELGRVTNQLITDNFHEIVDVDFTANMESQLDLVEAGKLPWKQVIRDFYGEFEKELEAADQNITGEKIALQDEVTDVICEKCGRNMVIKHGRYGKFLACPGYPECKNTKRLVTKAEGHCPRCGKELEEKTSKKGKKFFGCSGYPDCDFMTWDTPLKDTCPVCGKTLLRKNGKNGKIYCSNEHCDFEKGLDEV